MGWLTRAIKDDNIHPSATSENAHQHTPNTWLIPLVFHNRASHWLPSLSVHGNQTSHSWDTIRPWKFKVKGQGQRDLSLHSIHSNHCLGVSHQGILSTPIPYIPWQSGLPFPKYNLTLKIQSKVKVKGTLVSVTSSWLIFFCFTSIGSTIPKIWQIECSTGGKWIWNLFKKLLKKKSDRIPPKLNQFDNMRRGIYLPSFVPTLLWGQGKFCPVLVA